MRLRASVPSGHRPAGHLASDSRWLDPQEASAGGEDTQGLWVTAGRSTLLGTQSPESPRGLWATQASRKEGRRVQGGREEGLRKGIQERRGKREEKAKGW